ncbi:MAG: hypothetical protein QOG77_1425 [Solirubrobacteraceae bacterium]|jgi:hypothetical protein|nr:hypothetical protein [Solirubrobacteraceae bacterium]
MSTDDELGRYAVRFSGEMTKDAAGALRTQHMGLQRRDTFFDAPVPYSTTVVVRAASEDDAVDRVRRALDGTGEFSGFQAVAFAPQTDDED